MPRTITFLTALAAALAVAVPVAAAEGQPTVPHNPARVRAAPTGWYTALVARSEALNRKYGLGSPSRTQTAGEPAWLRALRLRSEALNRKYGLDGGTGKALAAPRHTDAGMPGQRKDESG